jgi:hypothetical protein
VEDVNIIERAFQLAPECGSIEELKRKLAREGYFQVNAHLSGRQIRSQLHQRLNPALAQKPDRTPHDPNA